MRSLSSVLGNSQKLDGGAMFGHVPKTLWAKWILPDNENRIMLSCRALLVQEENRNILLETGIGSFFNPVLQERYGVEEPDHVLLNSLNKLGLTDHDIDIVILSHLHFDHAGGLLAPWNKNQTPTLLFPNAKYLVSKAAWARACYPNMRDRASFIPHLNTLLEQSGRLVIIENERSELLGNDYHFIFTDGHTPGLMHTVIEMQEEGPVIFVSDLIPGTFWVHLPVGMGYDRFSELLLEEKRRMLELAIKKNARLFYTHDPVSAMSYIRQEEDGKFIATEMIKELNYLK